MPEQDPAVDAPRAKQAYHVDVQWLSFQSPEYLIELAYTWSYANHLLTPDSQEPAKHLQALQDHTDHHDRGW